MLKKALAEHQSGRLKEAEVLYRQAQRKFPNDANILYLLGTLYSQIGKNEESIKILGQVIAANPKHPESWNSIGLAKMALGKQDEAMDCYKRAIEINPDYSDPRCNIATILIARNRLDEAEKYAQEAVDLSPNSDVAYFNLGEIMKLRDRFEEAAQYYRRGVEINPNSEVGFNNLGSIYKSWGRYEEAYDCLKRALALKPDMYSAQSNLGGVLEELGRFDEANEAYQRAIEIDPEDVTAQWNRSLLYLKQGMLKKGWEAYENRYGIDKAKQIFPYPVWDGSPLDGKRLLVYAEQGLGDEILFASCIPDLLATGAQCVIHCDIRLESLYARSFPQAIVKGALRNATGWLSTVPKIDLQVSVGSLPRFFRPNLESFPEKADYLVADPVRVDYWRARVAELGPGLKIGICWRSGLKTGERFKHYTQLTQWGEIFAIPGLHFVNLQYDECSEELKEVKDKFGVEIANFTDLDLRNELDETSALIKSLDLVISASTAPVEFAAAQGVETFRLEIHTPSWTSLGTDRMPWHPLEKSFRQPTQGDWDTPLSLIAQALRDKLRGHEAIFEYVQLPSKAEIAVDGSFDDMATYVLKEQLGWFDPEYGFFVDQTKPETKFVDAGAGIGAWSVPISWKGGKSWALTQTAAETGFILNSRKKNGLDKKIDVAIAYGISLDFLLNRYGLEDIDLIRVDQAFSTPDLVDKGKRFFSINSPLVLFGIRPGGQFDLSLAERFLDAGYKLFRYVSGLNLLVPFSGTQELDAFSLNLFACKEDRAEQLEKEGKLIRTIPAVENLPGIDQTLWQEYFKTLHYAEDLAQGWDKPDQTAWEVYWMALNLFAMARSPEKNMGERYACLKASSSIMETLVKDAANLPRLASLSRILSDSGRREITVHVLNHMLSMLESGTSLNEPFLALAESYEKTDPGVKHAEWFVSMLLEQRERLRAFSSFFTGNESLPVLEDIGQSGFLSEDMARRLALLVKRFEASQA